MVQTGSLVLGQWLLASARIGSGLRLGGSLVAMDSRTNSTELGVVDLEFKRKELEDADAMRDAQRKMTWFALAGLLLYPAAIVLAVIAKLDTASQILGDMAPTYFVAVAGIVAAFFGSQAFTNKKK